MTTGQRGKSRKWPELIRALLTTETISEAAAQAGVSERTVLRCIKNPEFAKQFSEAQARLSRACTNTLLTEGNQAAKTLAVISKDARAPTGSRVTAASRIIELGREGYHLEELEKRLVEVERSIARESQ
jgi:hypothetical protein